jgi:hypothetical protein
MKTPPRIPAKLAAVLVAGATLAAAAPTLAQTAADGQAGSPQYGPSGTGGVQYGAPLPSGQIGSAQLHVSPQAMLGNTVHFSGTVAPGAPVTIQRLDRNAEQWLTATTATADADGNYAADWHADHIGVFSVRLMPTQSDQAQASDAAGAVRLTVYKPAMATWYGPGFYGKRTACGVRLTRNLVGVAHRGLPCGRQVALLYHGRTITVPVVDRGPYGSREAAYDLTAAAARELGFDHTDRIGAVEIRPTR